MTEDLPAWCPNLRCKTPIRTTDTRYYTDPSIATAALGIGPGELMNDLTTFGLFFETMALMSVMQEKWCRPPGKTRIRKSANSQICYNTAYADPTDSARV